MQSEQTSKYVKYESLAYTLDFCKSAQLYKCLEKDWLAMITEEAGFFCGIIDSMIDMTENHQTNFVEVFGEGVPRGGFDSWFDYNNFMSRVSLKNYNSPLLDHEPSFLIRCFPNFQSILEQAGVGTIGACFDWLRDRVSDRECVRTKIALLAIGEYSVQKEKGEGSE